MRYAVAVALLLTAGCAGTSSSAAPPPPPVTTSSAPAPSVPTTPAAPAYPPRSFADLDRLGQGAATYRQIDHSQIGVSGCTGQRVVIVVPKGASKAAIAAAMAHVYIADGMSVDGTAVVFAYYRASDNGRLPYTAGALQVDSPCDGTTPRTVEVDIGNSIGQYRAYKITS